MQVPAPGQSMSILPKTEYERLKRICYNGLTNDDLLSPFHREFLAGFTEKLEKYERHTYVSDAQDEVFNKLEQTLREELGDDYED